jgi:hypothetical protein
MLIRAVAEEVASMPLIYTLPTVNGSAAMFTSELISALIILCVPVGHAACCLLPLAVDMNLLPATGDLGDASFTSKRV